MAALYGTVYVSQSPHFSSHTLFRMCSCISTCIYVHPTPHVSSIPYALLHGNLDFPVWQCVCVCPSHPTTGPTPWLKCVHASVHVYMSTWLSMCASPFVHSYMETWVPLCGSVCVCVCCSKLACGPTPWLKCVHASLHVFMSTEFRILVHPLCIVIWKHGFLGVARCVCSSQYTFGPTHCWECVNAERRCGTTWLVTEILTWGHPGAHMLAATMWRGWGRFGESGGHACMCWCIYTLKPRCRNRWAMTGICRWGNTGMDRFEHNYVKGLGRIALVSLSNKYFNFKS